MADQDVVHVARSRWRADLNDYGAAAHEGFGDKSNADAKRAEAENLRAEADLVERYVAAKEADRDGPEAESLAIQLREHRQQWRSEGFRLSVLNNFEEPSDSELIAGGKSK